MMISHSAHVALAGMSGRSSSEPDIVCLSLKDDGVQNQMRNLLLGGEELRHIGVAIGYLRAPRTLMRDGL
jgi:hypothetical protein